MEHSHPSFVSPGADRDDPTAPDLLFTSRLVAAGDDLSRVQRAARRGTLTRVRRGAYVDTKVWEAARAEERHRLTLLAVLPALPEWPLLGYESAAVLHGIPLVGPVPEQVQVVSQTEAGGRSSRWVRRRGTSTLPPAVQVQGLDVTSAARTVLDLARVRSLPSALAAADHVLRHGTASRRELAAALEDLRGSRGFHRAAAVVRLADPRSESVGESVSRGQMHLIGVPAPSLQRELFDDAGMAGRVDFWWEDIGVAGEFDGRVKYRTDGYARVDAEEVVWREKLREDRLRRCCRGFVRWTWKEAMDPRTLAGVLARAGIRSHPPAYV